MSIFSGVNTKTLESFHSDYRSVIDPSNATLFWRLLDTRQHEKTFPRVLYMEDTLVMSTAFFVCHDLVSSN